MVNCGCPEQKAITVESIPTTLCNVDKPEPTPLYSVTVEKQVNYTECFHHLAVMLSSIPNCGNIDCGEK